MVEKDNTAHTSIKASSSNEYLSFKAKVNAAADNFYPNNEQQSEEVKYTAHPIESEGFWDYADSTNSSNLL